MLLSKILSIVGWLFCTVQFLTQVFLHLQKIRCSKSFQAGAIEHGTGSNLRVWLLYSNPNLLGSTTFLATEIFGEHCDGNAALLRILLAGLKTEILHVHSAEQVS